MRPFPLFALIVLLAAPLPASAASTTFDLRNRGGNLGFTESFTRNDITLSLNANPDSLISTPATFGIDSTGADDIPDLIDGGNNNLEGFFLSFSQTVFVESVTTSQWDIGIDAATLGVKSQTPVPLGPGTTTYSNLVAGATSGHKITWSGAMSPGAGRGFSVDSITVRPVPEPGIATLLLLAVLVPWRRRRTIAPAASSVRRGS